MKICGEIMKEDKKCCKSIKFIIYKQLEKCKTKVKNVLPGCLSGCISK